jgi:hypothetical protein
MPTKGCAFTHADGRPCAATPMRTGCCCFWHEPDRDEDVAKARQLGGLRRKREKSLAGVHDVTGLRSTGDIRRALEIAYLDTLNLDNSVPRTRALVAVVGAAVRLLKVEEERSFSVDPDEA